MDTNRLKQFCRIVETGTLRKAADLLKISHSGLSKSMKSLETELGYSLFLPHGRGIAISDEGMRLYKRTPSFFKELAELLGDPPPTTQHLTRMGSFEVFTTYFMGKLIQEFLSETEVEVHELTPGKLEEALLLDRIDLGITYEPLPRPGIEYVKITSVSMGAYTVRGAFSETSGKPRPWSEVPFVVPAIPLEGAPSGVKGLDAWPDGRHQRKILYRVDLMTTGLELTRQGLCAIFIPRFVAELHNEGVRGDGQLHPLELPQALQSLKRDVYLVKRESTPETPVLRQVARALRRLR